jgi:hypothetical protein
MGEEGLEVSMVCSGCYVRGIALLFCWHLALAAAQCVRHTAAVPEQHPHMFYTAAYM